VIAWLDELARMPVIPAAGYPSKIAWSSANASWRGAALTGWQTARW